MTNPEQPLLSGYSDSSIIALAEPNGLYTNNVTSSATWVLSVDANGV